MRNLEKLNVCRDKTDVFVRLIPNQIKFKSRALVVASVRLLTLSLP